MKDNYFQNQVSIHPIESDPCDMVPKDELDMDSYNQISSLNINPSFIYFIYSMTGTGGDTPYTTILNQKRDWKKWKIYSLYQ